MNVIRFDIHNDGASSDKVVQNISNNKIFQQAIIQWHHDNCPRGKLPSSYGLGLGQGQFQGWGGVIFLEDNCPRTLYIFLNI